MGLLNFVEIHKHNICWENYEELYQIMCQVNMCVYEEWIIPPRLLNAKQVKPIQGKRGEAAASAVAGY